MSNDPHREAGDTLVQQLRRQFLENRKRQEKAMRRAAENIRQANRRADRQRKELEGKRQNWAKTVVDDAIERCR